MGTMRTFLRANGGRWLWTAAAVLLTALVPEYAVPVVCFVAFLRTVRRGAVPLRRTELCIAAYFLWTVIGVLYSGARVTALGTLVPWAFFFFCGRMTANTIHSRMQLDAVLFSGALSGGLAGAVGIFQMFLFHYGDRLWKPLKVLFNPFWHFLDMGAAKLFFKILPERFAYMIPRTQFISIVTRASGTFTNPVFYAVFLCMAVPFCMYGLFYFGNRKRRLVSLVCLAFSVGGIAVSYSRGPYLALGIVFAVLLFYGKRYMWKILAAGAAFLAVFAVAAGGVFRRLLTLFSTTDVSVNTRSDIWKACFQMLRGHWLFGYGSGVGNVRDRLHDVYGIRQPHAHNLFLEIVLENGLVGLLLFLAILAVFLRQMLRLAKQGGRARGTAITLLSSVAGFCACGMTDYLFYGLKPLCYLLLVLGLSECAVQIYMNEIPHTEPIESEAKLCQTFYP